MYASELVSIARISSFILCFEVQAALHKAVECGVALGVPNSHPCKVG